MPRSVATSTVIEIHTLPGVSQHVKMNWLRDRLKRIAETVDGQVARLAVALMDDTGMIELHSEYLRHKSTTDVLTFPNSRTGDPVDVDIAVSVDVAAREATRHGHPLEQELLLYILHGLLHCCGFDDHDRSGYAAMHAEEDRILTAIGVGPTFSKRVTSNISVRRRTTVNGASRRRSRRAKRNSR